MQNHFDVREMRFQRFVLSDNRSEPPEMAHKSGNDVFSEKHVYYFRILAALMPIKAFG